MFFQYPTANIYLTTSWRGCGGGTEACANRAFRDPARLFLAAGDGRCNFDDGRDGKTKSNSHFTYAPGAQLRKTFSQNWLSHYGTISKSSSNLGGGTRAEMRNNGGGSLTGDQGGGEEV